MKNFPEALILDPRTGRVIERGLHAHPDLVELNGLLAERAEKDGRFKRIVSFLERDRYLSGLGAAITNVGGVAWRDYVPGNEYMVASQTAIAGTAQAMLYPATFAGIPSGFMQPGKQLKKEVWGKATTAASSPGNLTLQAFWGTSLGGTSLATSAASALGTSQTNITWRLEESVTAQAVGPVSSGQPNGSVLYFGEFSFDLTTAGLTGGSPIFIPASAAAAVAVDTTTAQGLVTGATLGSASDGMTTMMLSFESIN